jgi:MFS family permease
LGATWGWGSATTTVLLVMAVLTGATWVMIELRSTTPLIDMRIMRLPAVWTANLASLLFGIGLYSATGYIPSFLQTPRRAGYGFSASITESGTLTLPLTVCMLITGLAAAPLARRLPTKLVMMLGSVPPVGLFLMFAFAHSQRWEVLVAGAIGGLGFGIALSALSAYVVRAVPPSSTGAAAGMNANIRTIGGAVGTAIVATVLAAHTGHDGLPAEQGWMVAFIALTVVAAIGAATCLLIPGVSGNQN